MLQEKLVILSVCVLNGLDFTGTVFTVCHGF